jgi:hypothetical protein
LRFEGYRDASVDFELVAHRAMDVRLDLQPAPKMPVQAPTAAPPRAVTPAKDGTGHGVSPWTWTAFGVGAAALGGALVFELLRAGAENDVKNEPTQIARHDAYDRMQSRQKTARILAGVGGAAVVVGGVLLYFDLSSQGQSPQQKQVGLGCAPGSCAALVRGRF